MLNTWMWQFGGAQNHPLTPKQLQEAHAQLKYFMLEPMKRELQNVSDAETMAQEERFLIQRNGLT